MATHMEDSGLEARSPDFRVHNVGPLPSNDLEVLKRPQRLFPTLMTP